MRKCGERRAGRHRTWSGSVQRPVTLAWEPHCAPQRSKAQMQAPPWPHTPPGPHSSSWPQWRSRYVASVPLSTMLRPWLSPARCTEKVTRTKGTTAQLDVLVYTCRGRRGGTGHSTPREPTVSAGKRANSPWQAAGAARTHTHTPHASDIPTPRQATRVQATTQHGCCRCRLAAYSMKGGTDVAAAAPARHTVAQAGHGRAAQTRITIQHANTPAQGACARTRPSTPNTHSSGSASMHSPDTPTVSVGTRCAPLGGLTPRACSSVQLVTGTEQSGPCHPGKHVQPVGSVHVPWKVQKLGHASQ